MGHRVDFGNQSGRPKDLENKSFRYDLSTSSKNTDMYRNILNEKDDFIPDTGSSFQLKESGL